MGFFDHLEATEVRLRVRDGAWMARFYGDALGFVVSDLGAGEIEVSAGAGLAPLVRLIVDPAARRATAGSAGLFHVAFLHPDRAGLGGAVRRLVDRGAAFADGDHGVSEAIYLEDPEGNGIELYADRPPEVWPRGAGGDVAMYTRSVDVEGLLGAAASSKGTAGVRIGHVHLSVTDLAASGKFYGERLGVVATQRDFPGALFMGRDGYHHHVGLNAWRSRRKSEPATLGLAGVTFRAAGVKAGEFVDPDGVRVRVVG